MMKQCGLTVASRSDSGVISSSVSESALSASDTAAPNSANFKNNGRLHKTSIVVDPPDSPPARKIRQRTASDDAKKKDREARSIAIEKAYVHDVYEQISQHISDNRYRAWPRVKQFLQDLEPGSILCDVGCGSGKYLGINPVIFNIGSDRCQALAQMAREKEHEVMFCDNLSLPFRDSSIDAVLSIAVIHHIATAERRVHALRELSRVLRVGGRVMISVWAMEQRNRKFESQDVLIPWHKPPSRVGSVVGNRLHEPNNFASTTTATTSDDDVTHYHAYTQTSDSDQKQKTQMSRLKIAGIRRRNGRGLQRRSGRSFDPSACDILDGGGIHGGPGFKPPYQSSSELSSPSNETCYSFVRKALQKFSASQRQLGPVEGGMAHSADVMSDDAKASSKFQWFRLAGLEKLSSIQSMQLDENLDKLDSASVLQVQLAAAAAANMESGQQIYRGDSGDSNDSSVGDIPIELPHLEDEDDMYNIHVFNKNKKISPRALPDRSAMVGHRGRSRSLDDAEMMLTKMEPQQKKLRLSLRHTRRAFTNDNEDGYVNTGPELTNHNEFGNKNEQDMSMDNPDSEEPELLLNRQKKMLKDIKSTLSASLKSIDVSIRSGSITSLSSGKSFVSNFSVKSDSGISLPAPKPMHVQELSNVQERPEIINLPPRLGRRNWDSEPVLNGLGKRRKKTEGSSLSEKSASKVSLCGSSMGEKEKSRAMQNVESKLMKAIKEVNESDISENNTPLNSPGPANLIGIVPIIQKTVTDTVRSPLVTSQFPFQEKNKTRVDVHATTSKDSGFLSKESQESTEKENQKVQEEEPTVSFDELKEKIKAMPKFRPFHSTANLGGSMDRGNVKDKASQSWGKQMSLHDELLSHERLTANEEMRRKIQKQQSLPDNNDQAPKRNRSLKEGLMEVVSKSKQFESLKQSVMRLRNDASTVVEEKEENLTPLEKMPPQTPFNSSSSSNQENNAGPQDQTKNGQTGQAALRAKS